ncbi:MAG: hypothetical protein QOE63_2005 [Acidimicrobiaceae bacterium]
MRETQQGQPALRSSGLRLGFAERLLGAVEITEPAADLAELHEPGGRVGAADAGQLCARAHDLLLGFGPLASALQRPRVVHAADAREQRERVAL